MTLKKCPRCELNYILDGGDLCTVCRKEVRGEDEMDEIAELCSECGENPAVPGGELCLNCLKEMTRRLAADPVEDDITPGESPLEIDSVSTMDEIVIDLGDDIPVEEFEGEDLGDEEEEEEEEPAVEAFAEDDGEDEDDDLLDR